MCLNYYYTAKVNGRQRTIWWAAQIRKRNKSWILSCPTENKSQLANVLAMKVGVVRPVWELNALENENLHFIWLDVCPKTQTQAPLGTKMFMQLDSIFRSQSKQLNDVSQTHTHTHMETRSLRISRFVCLCGLENLLWGHFWFSFIKFWPIWEVLSMYQTQFTVFFIFLWYSYWILTIFLYVRNGLGILI